MALSTLLVAVAGTAARVMMAATKVMAREEAEGRHCWRRHHGSILVNEVQDPTCDSARQHSSSDQAKSHTQKHFKVKSTLPKMG